MVIATPPLCANGCGFYGSVETKNLCSKCYKLELFNQELSNSAKTKDPTSSAAPGPSVSIDSASVSSPSKLKNRCESCNRKLGLMGFTCRCGKVFCQLHRYPLEHSCNYKSKQARSHESLKTRLLGRFAFEEACLLLQLNSNVLIASGQSLVPAPEREYTQHAIVLLNNYFVWIKSCNIPRKVTEIFFKKKNP